MSAIDFDAIPEEAFTQFHADVHDNLDVLESALLRLETAQNDPELIALIFRAVHSIKGAAGMYGYNSIERLTHVIESVYAKVRRRELPVHEPLINLTLHARDLLGQLIDQPVDHPLPEAVLAQFQSLLEAVPAGEAHPAPAAPSPAAAPAANDGGGKTRYRVQFRFRPEIPLFQTATNPLWYLDALAELGPHQVLARLDHLPPLAELRTECCYLHWVVEVTTNVTPQAIEEEFQFVRDELAELLIEEAAPDAPPSRPSRPSPPKGSAKPLKILISDDEFPNRLLLKKMLENHGDCDMVVDGQETVEIFAMALADQSPYDLVLLDIMMPGMDGQSALQEIRRLERQRKIPPNREAVVIMVTALDTPKHVFRAYYQGGCTDYLAKPVTQEQLFTKLVENGLLDPAAAT